MLKNVVNEQSTGWVFVSFYNVDNQVIVLDTLVYTIDDFETDNSVKTTTSVNPQEESVIRLAPEDNVIISTDLHFERKILTVIADFGSGQELKDQFVYYVKNLKYYE